MADKEKPVVRTPVHSNELRLPAYPVTPKRVYVAPFEGVMSLDRWTGGQVISHSCIQGEDSEQEGNAESRNKLSTCPPVQTPVHSNELRLPAYPVTPKRVYVAGIGEYKR